MITAKFVGSLQILGESVLTTSKRGGSFYKLRVRFDIAHRVGSLQILVESSLTTEKYGGGLMKYSSLKSIFEEGAYGKAGNGNKTETGNGNWKQKPETENRNGNKRRTNHWCSIFFIVCLVITQAFYLAIVMVLAL